QQEPNTAAVNQALADDLHLEVGSEFLVYIDRSGAVSNEVLFAKRNREDTLSVLRLRVAMIVSDSEGGGFGLQAGATSSRNVFLSREQLAETLEQPGLANVVLVGESRSSVQTALASTATLADHGLKLVRSEANRYLALESSALLFNSEQIAAAKQAAAEVHATAVPTSVYLAARIVKVGGKEEIAYAVMSSMPWEYAGDLSGNGVVLNSWAAEDLNAKLGDEIELTYLVPTRAGDYLDAAVRLKVVGVVELYGPAADRHLTPDLNGLTDAKRIDEWKLPFPIDRSRITSRDDAYWDKYAATPKLFAAPETMQRIWSSASSDPASREEGGGDWVTGIRITPPENVPLVDFETQLIPALLKHLTPEKSQMVFRPVRDQLLASAAGSTDFAMLFLSMSFFLVFAAAALAGTLMRLLVEQRVGEVGVMLASGWRRRNITSLLVREGVTLTAVGVLLGVPAGILYNNAIIYVMNHWWMQPWGNEGGQALTVHITPQSIAIGTITGLMLGIVCVIWGVRSLGRLSLLRLISGRNSLAVKTQGLTHPASSLAIPRKAIPAILTAVLAVTLLILSTFTIIPPTLGFFLSGTALLIAMLLFAGSILSTAIKREATSMSALAIRNAAANRRRSILTIFLLAAATFILVAVAANRRDYSKLDTTNKLSGSGGFTLSATTSVPLHYDLATPQGRKLLGFTPEEEKAFTNVTVIPLMESTGDDVSCLNLAQPTHPRLLGVSPELADWNGFSVNLAKLSSPDPSHICRCGGIGGSVIEEHDLDRADNPWAVLFDGIGDHVIEDHDAIPAFADADSLQWILKISPGGIYQFDGPDGSPVKLRIVGIIPGSIFASELLVSEANLKRIYPKLNGSTRFLFVAGDEQKLADVLRTGLADQGIEVHTTREILNRYISVQNVYMSIFLSLGGLGLLLGTAGMVAVIARSVLERRGELALMAAAGFKRSALVHLVMIEHIGLLAVGLFCGTAAALLAVAPVLASGHADVQWLQLAITLITVAVVGVIVCIITARIAIDRNPIRALREE
ncbi:MAG: ABC transporter permease, partial [Phycisphaerales bacterium]|nr:ABC transporter permease [Phycisphaerales bacterium]